MISEIEISQFSFAAEIHRLAQSAYAVEAETIACTAFPPLDESLEELQRSGDRFLAARENGSIVGGLSFALSATNRLVTGESPEGTPLVLTKLKDWNAKDR